MPDRHAGHAFVADAEQLAGDLEETLEDVRESEVRPKEFRVELEILGAHQLRIEIRVPRVEGGRARRVLPFAVDQDRGVFLRAFLRGGADLRQEVADAFRGSDHLVLHDVIREALVSEDPREFVARRHELGQRPEVRRMTAVQVLPLEPPSDRKSTRLNSSHGYISYAVFCLKKKKKHKAVDATPHNC